MIKKIVAILIFLFTIFNFVGCESGCSKGFSEHYCMYGVENFDVSISSNGTGDIWSPYNYNETDELFCDRFKSIKSDFYYTYDKKMFSDEEKETILYYIVYDGIIYQNAKEELFNDTMVCNEHIYEYNGYQFYHNLSSNIPSEGKEEECFCWHSHMICFNDDKNLIMSIGLLDITDLKTTNGLHKADLIYTDIGAFLKEYFYYYDFDAETPSIDVDRLERDYGKQLKR